MRKPESPCKVDGVDCPKRVVGCRTDCTPWNDYEKAKIEYRDYRIEQANKERDITEYKLRGVAKRLHIERHAKRK